MGKIIQSFFCLIAAFLLVASPALAEECKPVLYDAAKFEAGDRVPELGDNPKIAVGQDKDTRYFTGEHINFSMPATAVEQIEVLADFHEDKETIFQLFAASKADTPAITFHQDYQHLWVIDGGKKKDRKDESYYHYKKPNSYRFVFRKGTIRVFLNQEYIGSVEAGKQFARLTINSLNDRDKIFSVAISPNCNATPSPSSQ